MKKIIISFSIALLLFFFYSCSRTEASNRPDTTVVSVMVDVTDSLVSLPEVESIKSQFSQLNADHTSGAIFHTAILSDVQYTPETQIEVKPVNFLFSNPGERNVAVDSFFNQVGQTVKALRALPRGESHSELYVPIAKEANRLMTIPASDRILLVYSNLYENSFFSLYRADDIATLEDRPEQVAAMFYQKQPLQNLKGLHVYFLYQPTGYDDNQLYAQISNVYQQMFENAGAIVTISANLPNQ